MSEVSLALISDLHSEVCPLDLWAKLVPREGSSVLILAGDIGNANFAAGKLLALLFWCRSLYKYTIYVPGNHEYRDASPKQSKENLEKLIKRANTGGTKNSSRVILLDRSQCILEFSTLRLYILGATLWSWVDPSSPIAGQRDSFLNTCERNALHCADKAFLEEELAKLAQIKKERSISQEKECLIVVVTHHPPVDDFAYGEHASYYGNSLHSLVNYSDFWICGHVHAICSFEEDFENLYSTLAQEGKLRLNPAGRWEEKYGRKTKEFVLKNAFSNFGAY